MQSQFSESDKLRAIQTLDNVNETIDRLFEWNIDVESTSDYYSSQSGMQLLAANCMLITAIGEGVNRVEKILPGFLGNNFPEIPWRAIVGMRNHLAHGYFELDAEVVLEAVKVDLPPLKGTIMRALGLLGIKC